MTHVPEHYCCDHTGCDARLLARTYWRHGWQGVRESAPGADELVLRHYCPAHHVQTVDELVYGEARS